MNSYETGTCEVCGQQNVPVSRAYFYYGIQCECHSPEHFEIVFHCLACTPKPPTTTKVEMKPKMVRASMCVEERSCRSVSWSTHRECEMPYAWWLEKTEVKKEVSNGQ